MTLNQASRLAIITLLFRDAGVVSPLAETALVKLYRGDELKVGPSEYAMVENINDIENHDRRKIRTLSRNTLDPHGVNSSVQLLWRSKEQACDRATCKAVTQRFRISSYLLDLESTDHSLCVLAPKTLEAGGWQACIQMMRRFRVSVPILVVLICSVVFLACLTEGGGAGVVGEREKERQDI